MSHDRNRPLQALGVMRVATRSTITNNYILSRDKKSTILFLYIASYALLATVYVLYTSSTWSYMGLSLSINRWKIVVSLAVIATFSIAVPNRWSVRSFLLNVILTIYLLPSLILYGFSDKPTSSALVIWLAITIVYAVSGIRIPRIDYPGIGTRWVMSLFLVLSGGLLVLFIFALGLGNFNLDFSKVYDLRRNSTELLSGMLNYLSFTFTNTIIPFGVAIALHHKKRTTAGLFAAMSIIMFGLTSHKVMAFMPLAVCGTFLLLSWRSGYLSVLRIFCALAAILSVGVITFPYFGVSSSWGWFESLFMWRSLIVPAMLDYLYIDFFSENAKYYWSISKVSLGLVDVPHNGVSAPHLIGSVYFGNQGMEADTGFIGSGFAQAGLFGVFLYAIGTGLIIAFFQTYGRYLSVPLVAAATLGLFLPLIQASDFVALFLTHGLLLTLVVLASLREQKVGDREVIVRARRFGISELPGAQKGR